MDTMLQLVLLAVIGWLLWRFPALRYVAATVTLALLSVFVMAIPVVITIFAVILALLGPASSPVAIAAYMSSQDRDS